MAAARPSSKASAGHCRRPHGQSPRGLMAAPASGAAAARAVPSSDPSVVGAVLETRRRLGRTTIVGISGIDCAGKTTLAGRLAEELRAARADAVVIGGDHFNRPRSERSTFPAKDPDYGFDYRQLISEVLIPARRGERVDARLCVKDWER